MARIVIGSHGTTGAFVPFIPLARALMERGHSVLAAVNEAMQPLFRHAGLDVVDCGARFGPEEARGLAGAFDDWSVRPERQLLEAQLKDIPGNYRDLLAACRGADLLVAGATQCAAALVSQALRMPWVCVHGHAALFPHEPDDPELPHPEANLHLLASSPHFSRPRRAASSPHLTGFWHYAAEDQPGWTAVEPELRAFVEEGEPPLALLPGSMPVADPRRLVAVHAKAAAYLARRLVIQEGWAGLSRGHVPARVDPRRLHFARTLPHDWLLERTAAVIAHGAMGLVSRALRAGCPLLVEPYSRDQLFTARRIKALGLGTAMNPHQLTVTGLVRALEEKVLPAAVRQRAAELAGYLRAEDGVTVACARIEELIREPSRAATIRPSKLPLLFQGPHARAPERPLRLGFVVHRYGLDVVGGAELHCRQVAERLARTFEVEVITTCAHDYTTWANAYPPGTEIVNELPVHRFPTRRRRAPDFEQASAMLRREHTLAEEIRWLCDQGPHAPELLAYLSQKRQHYDFLLFFTYLYYPTALGLRLAWDRALLIPTFNPGELPATLDVYRALFHAPRGILYNTEEERDAVHAQFGNAYVPHDVAGVGFEAPSQNDPQRFRRRFGVDGSYALFLGRFGPSKGCDQLVDYFQRFAGANPGTMQLLLGGTLEMTLPSSPAIRFLGPIWGEDKWDALAGATAVLSPSPFDCLSMVTLEAWTCGRPVVCTAASPVVASLCRRSAGGLLYRDAGEFAQHLRALLADPDLGKRLGDSGRRFAQTHYSWETVTAKYERMLTRLLRENYFLHDAMVRR